MLPLQGTSRLISTDSEGTPYLSPPQQLQPSQNYSSAAASLLAVLSDEPLVGQPQQQQQQQQNTAFPNIGYAPNESQFEQSAVKAKKDKATKPKAEPIKLKIKTNARLRTDADLTEQLAGEESAAAEIYRTQGGRSTRRTTPTAAASALDTDNVPAPGTANYELYRTLIDSPSQVYSQHPQYNTEPALADHPALADYHTFNQSPPFNPIASNIPDIDAQNSQSPSDTERGILPKKRRGRNKAATKFDAAIAAVVEPTPPPPQPEIVTEEPVQKRQRGRRRHDEQQLTTDITTPASSEFINSNTVTAPNNLVEAVQPLENFQPKKRITAAAKKHYTQDEGLLQVEQVIPTAIQPPLPSLPSPVAEAPAPSEISEPPAANRRGRKAKAKANQNLTNTEQMSQPEAVVAVQQRPTRQTRHTANGNMARVSDF